MLGPCPRAQNWALRLPERGKIGDEIALKDKKHLRPHFRAPEQGSSICLAPETDRAPKITIGTSLRMRFWCHLVAILINMSVLTNMATGH